MKKRILAMMCSVILIILLTPSLFYKNFLFSVKAENNTNFALNKPAFSSGDEVDWLTPNLAVDGVVEIPSRWSSEYENDAWFYVDLGESTLINKVIIRWQTPAVRYKIQISDDAVTWKNALPNDEIILTEQKWDEVNTISFELQSARYVKFQGVETKPAHGYGIYEFEVYRDDSVEKIANSIKQAPTLTVNDTELILPQVPEGYSIKLYGSDKKPIIDLDGKITSPLVDIDVNLLFEVTNNSDPSQKAITDNILVKVPGLYNQTNELNEKPFVLPTLQEWHGGKGNLSITSLSRIVLSSSDKAVLENTANLLKEDFLELSGLDLPIVFGEPLAGDVYLKIDSSLNTLGEEGYILDVNDYLTLSSINKKGVFFGTRTVLQILKQNLDTLQIPKGVSRDYPKDENRGVMLDVARKFYTIEYLQDYVKLLSWYKMNYFQIHLNDDVYSPFEPGWAFRLECETYPGLTSSAESGFYTKKEFRELQLMGMEYGVNIVPEIDSPGHSGAFIAYDPNLGSGTHLNLKNSDTLPFIKALFDEYIDGPEPTFVGPDVHIGTDEYDTKNQDDVELFRAYTNQLIEHINSKGKRPHFWGSLTQYEGTTPISTDATTDIWAIEFGGVQQALDLGYDIINMENRPLYIVPIVSERTDYIDIEEAYNNWSTETFYDTKIPYGHPQMKGAVSALWNDFSAARGMSMDDSHDRFFPAVQLLSEKSWYGKNKDMDYETFTKIADAVGEAPGANLSHRVDIKTDDKKVVEYTFEDGLKDSSGNNFHAVPENAEIVKGKFGSGIQLKGGKSYLNTPVDSVGFGWTASMWIKPDLDSPSEGILLESPAGKLSLKAGKEKVKASSFNDVFGSSIGFEDSDKGLRVTSSNMGQRISSTKKHMIDGLTFSINDITVPKSLGANQNVYLAFTLADEHGHYHSTGAKGIHFRLMADNTNKLYFYIQKADLITDQGEGVYRAMLPLDGINNGMPESLKISFKKSGDKFAITVNGVKTEIPYNLVETLLPSEKAHLVFGGWTNGLSGGSMSYAIDDISLVSEGNPDAPSGKLVYAKEKYETPFDYAIPLGEWTHILLRGTSNGTSLYINGDEYYERIEEFGANRYLSTFALPLKYIGSQENSFKGVIDNVVVYDKAIDLLENVENLALKKQTKASSVEVPAFKHSNAVDGSFNTRWSSVADKNSWFSVDLGEVYSIENIRITWEIAYGKAYKILVSTDESNWVNVLDNDEVFHGFIGNQVLKFKKIPARYVKFQGVETSESYLGYSFYEFEVYGASKNFDEYNNAIRRASLLLDNKDGDASTKNQIMEIVNRYPYENDPENLKKLNSLLNSLQGSVAEEGTNNGGSSPQTGEGKRILSVGLFIPVIIMIIFLYCKKRYLIF